MNWQEKLAALQAIADTSLRMRAPGDWYVAAVGREIGGNGGLLSDYGNGHTPEEAVEDDWRAMVTDLPPNLFIVLNATDPERRKHLRWGGFMWKEVPR